MLALALACTEDDETSYTQYNGDSDEVQIDVGAEMRTVSAGESAGDCLLASGAVDDTDTGTSASAKGGTDSGADSGSSGTDTGTDSGSSGTDTETDTATDSGTDTETDTATDSGTDSATDTGTDTDSKDTGSDSADTGAPDNGVPEVAAAALTSTTESVVLGWACVSPSAGPIGTVHTVRVAVFDDYETTVDRATVRTDSGDRGKDTYEMERDSADAGYWKTELVSVGEDGEQRVDTLRFGLWVEDESEDEE